VAWLTILSEADVYTRTAFNSVMQQRNNY